MTYGPMVCVVRRDADSKCFDLRIVPQVDQEQIVQLENSMIWVFLKKRSNHE